MNYTQKYNLVKFAAIPIQSLRHAYASLTGNANDQGTNPASQNLTISDAIGTLGTYASKGVSPLYGSWRDYQAASTTDNYANPFVPQQNKQTAPTTNNMISQWEAPRQNSNNKETSSNHDGQSSQLETPTTYGKHPFAEQNKQTAPTTENANNPLANLDSPSPIANSSSSQKLTNPESPLANLDKPAPVSNSNSNQNTNSKYIPYSNSEYPFQKVEYVNENELDNTNPFANSGQDASNSNSTQKAPTTANEALANTQNKRYEELSYEQLSEIAGQRAKQMEQNNGGGTLVAGTN